MNRRTTIEIDRRLSHRIRDHSRRFARLFAAALTGDDNESWQSMSYYGVRKVEDESKKEVGEAA
jgi:hypothetical protein